MDTPLMETSNDYTVLMYLAYLISSLALTIWVARVLFKHGRLFLVEIFEQNEPLADSVNKLLQVGFYLVNIGYMLMVLTYYKSIPTPRMVVEVLSLKVGTIVLVLGFWHFINLFILFRLRKRHLLRRPAMRVDLHS